MHPLVLLAKKAVEEYCRTGKTIAAPGDLSGEMGEAAGVFVCLKKHGQLRGCIGTLAPTTECAAVETIKNSISAAAKDFRFAPVRPDELEDLEYTVDILLAPERVEDTGSLDPKKYGVIVSKGHRKGVLLPDIEGVDTAEEQLRIALLKAGLGPGEEGVTVERFEVKRYK